MNRTCSTLLAAAAALSLLALPGRASAQETVDDGGGGGGGGRSNFAFGIGAQAMLTGPAGVSATFDIGLVHIDTILFFADTAGSFFGDDDAFGIGGRAFYSLHQTRASDFGIGGGIGLVIDDQPGDDDTLISLEVGGKMRAFIVSNVALTAFLGIGILVDTEDSNGDRDGVLFSGQQVGFSTVGLTSGFGFTYYFN